MDIGEVEVACKPKKGILKLILNFQNIGTERFAVRKRIIGGSVRATKYEGGFFYLRCSAFDIRL